MPDTGGPGAAGRARAAAPAVRRLLLAAGTGATALTSCGGERAPSPVEAPGAAASPETRALEAGAAALQRKAPLDALNSYLDGFHLYNVNLQGQMEAHHFCGSLNEDVTQCVIYDGNGGDAKLMGLEYIVSARLFEGLPVEHELMERIVGTYGKTWHTWHTDEHESLPLGIPRLMMGFTADGQMDPGTLAGRNERLGISGAAKRENRADIPSPPIHAEANAWQKGIVIQLEAARARTDGRTSAASP